MKAEVAKLSTSDLAHSPGTTPRVDGGTDLGAVHEDGAVDEIPLLSEKAGSSGIDGGAKDVAKERKVGQLPA